ncbi:MAG: hypothetical protein ABIF09_13420 [Gemmatimonadota bacterium]
MIQVRNVPEGLHNELVRRARVRGQTLTDYLQGILERGVARPDREDVFRRILQSDPVDLPVSAATLIREGREDPEDPGDR